MTAIYFYVVSTLMFCVTVLSQLVEAKATIGRVGLSKKHGRHAYEQWIEEPDLVILPDRNQLQSGPLTDTGRNQREKQPENFEETPLGTLNRPVKVEYDYSNNSDLAMDDVLFSYVDQKIPVAAFLEEDYNGFWVLTRSGYEYESSPALVQNILSSFKYQSNNLGSNPEIVDLWNISVNIIKDFHAEQIPKSIFLPDTRAMIRNTEAFPYSSICHIGSGCTGTFVGPRHVLTAGHCIYNSISKKWRKNLDIRRAKSCDPNQGYHHSLKYAIISTGWKLLGLPAYDYAMIVVNEPSPSHMEIGWEGPISQRTVNINGYPGDKSRLCMWGSKCKVVWQSEHQLGHRCDTYYGMSGSAVYARDEGTGRPVIHCVHAYGRGLSAQFNKCTRITKARHALIRNWVDTY